jgi:hypothetical protein
MGSDYRMVEARPGRAPSTEPPNVRSVRENVRGRGDDERRSSDSPSQNGRKVGQKELTGVDSAACAASRARVTAATIFSWSASQCSLVTTPAIETTSPMTLRT